MAYFNSSHQASASGAYSRQSCRIVGRLTLAGHLEGAPDLTPEAYAVSLLSLSEWTTERDACTSLIQGAESGFINIRNRLALGRPGLALALNDAAGAGHFTCLSNDGVRQYISATLSDAPRAETLAIIDETRPQFIYAHWCVWLYSGVWRLCRVKEINQRKVAQTVFKWDDGIGWDYVGSGPLSESDRLEFLELVALARKAGLAGFPA